MDAVEFLKERTRMCDYYMSTCMNCPGNKVTHCATLCADAIDLIPIVEQWAKEHPVKTRQSELLKQYPDAKLYKGVLGICPAKLSLLYRDKTGQCTKNIGFCPDCRRDFWLKEIE